MGNDITILIGGAAGYGIQTIGNLLSKACHNAGLFIFSVDDFESRVRGGHNFHVIRISNELLSGPSLKLDILVAIDEKTYLNHKDELAPNGIILCNDTGDDTKMSNTTSHIPFEQLARDAGGKIASNTVAAGVILAILGASFKDLEKLLQAQFEKKGKKILALNLMAGKSGYDIGKTIQFYRSFDFNKSNHSNVVMSGAKAAALGALASDCRFFPFYPMSPGTGVIVNASAFAEQFPLVIEQAEDEIAAINMAVGASFAGVRSMSVTSGGGFCLMTEGLGLAAMAEIPVVIINAQRPGPATGLATRTAQSDLLFTINASQDEFPRFVFAPGSPKDTYNAVKKAFHLSEKYQVPSIVLMDQFLIDSTRTEPDDLKIGSEHESFLLSDTKMYQDEPYLRYKISDSGVSPRCTPCSGPFLVRSTGNEHTPEGLTSEDPENRNMMVEKRFKKVKHMKKEMKMPSLLCTEASFFLTGWGSSKGSIIEACLTLREQGIDASWIIFEDIWPLDEYKLKKILRNKKLVIVEGNATCQLGSLIRQLTGIDYAFSILKYDGRPIYPEYIIEKVQQIMGH
ncbi:MAG: 2-oxoacid:acceptor oxidoreductase subunit alpha [Desulfobacteraceae bacterium]|nr:2-oxoacid:acceptor oxidoreductase subunit alpha [Desulfobacteraceae bacterium]